MTAAPPTPQPQPRGRGRLLRNLPAEHRRNLLQNVTEDIKDVWQLFWHPAVRIRTKLIMVGTLIYVLMPDVLAGPVDDVIVVYLGTKWFLARATTDLANSASTEDQNDENVVDS